MKIMILGDLHFVSPDDPDQERRARRAHFAEAWPFFKEVAQWVRDEAPDLVISVGDLVDWYSDENRDFGIHLMEGLKTRWLMTPGNHDFSRGANEHDKAFTPEDWKNRIFDKWKEKGIELGNRTVDADGVRILLMDSHDSSVPEGTREWLQHELKDDRPNALVTHVPLNLPEVRGYIHSVDPKKNLEKYVQSGAPGLYEAYMTGRVRRVFNGHLHFSGCLDVDLSTQHFLSLSIEAVGKEYPGQGYVTILETEDVSVRQRGR